MRWILLALLLTGCVSLHNEPLDNNTLVLSTPEYFLPSTRAEWNYIDYELIHSHSHVIQLEWRGHGGWYSIGLPVRNAMRAAERQGKIVIVHVVGYAMSLHAYLACEGSKLNFDSNGFLMFHTAAEVDTGKVVADLDADTVGLIQRCEKIGVLRPIDGEEIETVHEVWVYPVGSGFYREEKTDHRAR